MLNWFLLLLTNQFEKTSNITKLILSTTSKSLIPYTAECKSEEEALLRWTEYYFIALNHPTSQPCPDLEHIAARPTAVSAYQRIQLDASYLDEVLAAINKLKNSR
jgi:hypothetical protein